MAYSPYCSAQRSPAFPWSHTARAAVSGTETPGPFRCFCPSRAAIIPASTSPDPPFCHSRVPRPAEPYLSLRGRGHRPPALEDQGAAVCPGKAAGGGHRVPHRQGATRQPGKLPRMGGEHRGSGAAVQNIYMSRQRVYAIGVQYHRDGQVAQQGTRQPLCVRMPAQSGADHRHIAGGRLFQYCSILLRQRKSHSFFTFYGYDRIDFPGDPHIDQPPRQSAARPGRPESGAPV